MDTWKNKHPNYDYICWTEEEFVKRNMIFTCHPAINVQREINGKADIMRWEILYKYGGIFIDADSICIEPLDPDLFLIPFVAYENEIIRNGLVATGTMAFYPGHPICKKAIEWIRNNVHLIGSADLRAWKTVGPGLLTKMLEENKSHDVTIYPSFYFLPVHYSGLTYKGHRRVYAYQEWGSTKKNYDDMNNVKLPDFLGKPPALWVSILISSYNTKREFIRDCLDSIINQEGDFGIEIVWVNDRSILENSNELKEELERIKKHSRFLTVVYKNNRENKGISSCLNQGLSLCSNEFIIKMDSDDVMNPERIKKQIEFMNSHPDCVMCGTDIVGFRGNISQAIGVFKTNHRPELTWESFKLSVEKGAVIDWFLNHPTLCYKKSAVSSVGGYDEEFKHGDVGEDYHLEVRILKKFGKVYNMPEALLYYRLHEKQSTYDLKKTPEREKRIKKFLNTMMK